jgi:hypothetical protein
MFNENIKLEELEELRETFQLMDEKLDSQEIVTPEQIRTATMEKVDLLETEVKTTLIWGYVIGFPLLTLFFHFTGGLSNAALWTAGIFGFISILINAFILRKVSRKDFLELDLNTLMTKERRYRRTFLIIAASTFIFWVAFGYIFISLTCGILYTLMLVAMDIPRFYNTFVRAYKEGLQGRLDEKETLMSRVAKVIRIVLLSICTLALAAAFVLYVIAIFKTYQDEGFSWWLIFAPIALLSAVISFIPLIINLIKNNIGQRMPTISVVGFTIAIAIFAGYFLVKFISGEDKNVVTALIPLLIAIWILYNNYKKK